MDTSIFMDLSKIPTSVYAEGRVIRLEIRDNKLLNHYALEIHRFKTRMKFDEYILDGRQKSEDGRKRLYSLRTSVS